MKMNSYSRRCFALASVLLATSGAVCSASLFLNSFDTAADIAGFNPGTCTITWDSSQNSPTSGQAAGSGSMYIVCPWANTQNPVDGGGWTWEEFQISNPTNFDLTTYVSMGWDVKVDQPNSYTDWTALGYGYSQIILQSYTPALWGGPSSYMTTNVGWQHLGGAIPAGFNAPMNVYLVDFNNGGWNRSPSNTVSLWFDAIQLISPSGPPPRLSFGGPATPGLNFWTITPDGTRHGIYTKMPNYTWVNNGNTTYSFSIADFPTNAADAGYAFNMNLVGGSTPNNNSASDWNNASVIMSQLTCDTNGIASWNFHWKTNSAGSNGQYYDWPWPVVTNPTPIGTWTMTFDASGAGVTMTAPGGDSSTFTLGTTTNTSDLTQNADYINGAWISLNVNGYTGTNNQYKRAVLSRFSASSAGFVDNGFTNDWTKSVVDTNIWAVDAGDARFCMLDVPASNAYYLKWILPDNGFRLQTNNAVYNKLVTNYTVVYDINTNPIATNVNVGGWSTNGVPQAMIPAPGDLSHAGISLDTNRYALILPSTFPTQYGKSNLLFRLSQPGF